MMTINTQKLREAAQAVIDGFGTDWYYASDWNRPGKDQPPDCDVRHIVEASPAAVIDLLDIVDAANEQVTEYARLAEQTRTEADARIDAQAAEIARLREAQADTRSDIQNLEASRDGYRRDVETLRDALLGLLDALPSATTHPAIQEAKAALQETDHD